LTKRGSTFLWKSTTEAVPRLSTVLQDPGRTGRRRKVGSGSELATLADGVSTVSVRPLLAEQPGTRVVSGVRPAPAGLDRAPGRATVLVGDVGGDENVVVFVLLLDRLAVEVAASEVVDVAFDGVVERLQQLDGVGSQPPLGAELPG